MSALLHDLTSDTGKGAAEDDPKLILRIANALWLKKQYPFDPAFVNLVRDQYQAEANAVDFSDAATARKLINDWVAKKTSGKIVDLIPEGVPDPITRLIVTNAVYFNGQWSDQFNKSATADSPFHVSMDKTTTVPMMRQTAHFGYAETPQLQAIALPYARHDASMLILLPKSGDGLSALESDLSARSLDDLTRSLKYPRIDLSLPRFKIEQSMRLPEALRALGMKLAFDPDHADFSGMCSVEPLFVGDVLHKAFVRVDEEGTEAAAATAVVMRAGSVMREDQPLRIVVDHPFLLMIRHEKTGEILFMGRVRNPVG
jgi:serpin B